MGRYSVAVVILFLAAACGQSGEQANLSPSTETSGTAAPVSDVTSTAPEPTASAVPRNQTADEGAVEFPSAAKFELSGVGADWVLEDIIDMPAETEDPTDTICGTHYPNAHPAHQEATYVTRSGTHEASLLIIRSSGSSEPWMNALRALATCSDLEPRYQAASFAVEDGVSVSGASSWIVVSGSNGLGGPEPVGMTIAAADFGQHFLILSVATTDPTPPTPAQVVELLETVAGS